MKTITDLLEEKKEISVTCSWVKITVEERTGGKEAPPLAKVQQLNPMEFQHGKWWETGRGSVGNCPSLYPVWGILYTVIVGTDREICLFATTIQKYK